MTRKILLLSYGLDLGGSERQLTEVARALDPKRFEVHVGCQVSSGVRAEELKASEIPIISFPMSSYISWRAILNAVALRTLIRRHGIDLVHAFDVPMDVFATFPAKASVRPIVLTSQRAHRSLTTGLRLPLLRATDRIADGIVVNCEYIRKHLIKDEHIPARKLHLCYNGLDLTRFVPTKRAEASVTPTIGTICALREEKNLPVLLRAFAQARRRIGNARLLIVGSGPAAKELHELCATLELGELIQFVPATADVPCWLREIDVFVLPSRTEALSNALMEAMATGCAVVASDVGGNPELTGQNERGLLFPSGDDRALCEVLVRMVNDAELRARLSAQARRFVEERLSIEASVRCMTEIYDSFLAR